MGWTAAATAVFFLPLVTPLFFDCAQLRDFCICYKEQSSTEIQCPNQPLSSFPISFKIVPLSDSGGKLTINCDPENEHFNSSLAKGLNFSQTIQNFTLKRIEINFCPSIGNTLEEFFQQVEINASEIVGFSFVTFSRRNISSLPASFLSSMPNLEDLNLKSNKLQMFPSIGALTQLKSLNLYDNLLTSIPPHALSSNSLLSSLQLNKNKLTQLPALPVSLNYLNLANNRISVLTRETLSRLKNLRVLDLRWNPLSDMEQDVFTDMDELRILNIDSSQFKNFPSLVNLPKLTNVSISHAEGANVLSGDERGKMEELPGLISNLPSLTGLVLANDSLPSLPQLENLPNLTYINLSRNRIVKIPKGAFGNLPALTTIDLARNLISEVEEIQATFLTSLDLSGNLIESLNSGAFKYLSKLKKLNLAFNKISTVSPVAFESQSELEWLDMSQNLIDFESKEEKRSFPSDSLLLANAEIPQSPLRFCMKLKTLLLRNNSIAHLASELSYLLIHLSTLDLSYNKFKSLNAVDLNYISLDLRLDLSNNELSVIDMDKADLYLDTEVSEKKRMVVKLDGNPLNCDCRLLPLKNFKVKWITFSYEALNCATAVFPNLLNKRFKDVDSLDLVCPVENSSGCPLPCSCFIRPSDETILLNCSTTPDSIFPSLNALENKYKKFSFRLSLAQRGISKIQPNATKELSSRVEFVDLSGNELESLELFEGLGEQNQTNFALGFNRFQCDDCEFHASLRSRFRQISDFSNLTCFHEGQFVKVASLHEFESLCNQTNQLSSQVEIILIFFTIFAFFLVLGAVLYVRHGWALRAYFYSKGYSCFCLNDDYEGDEEKIYDAFVSYSHHDEEWVLEKLVNRLEEEEGFKLCLHFRDWTPGDWIPDQIVRSVDTSRRTVVVLSKHFVDSVWSKLEFKAAHSQALKERSNKVILILMDDELNESECGDEDLKIYMKMNTYLKWGDPWFWHKLKYALPHRSRTNLVQVHEQHQRAIMLDKLREKMEPI